MHSQSLLLKDVFSLPLVFSTGELATQANGSIVVSYGDNVVLVTACMSSKPLEGVNFFPLTVEYQEKTYARGKIPGGFIKREGRPKDEEILSARLIDRPLRPLFPEGFTHEVQIIAMVLSSDGQYAPDVLAINGASCALLISDIPFYTPVGAVRISKVDEELVVNPSYEQREKADYEVVVVGTEEKIVMIEGVFYQTKEEEILLALEKAQRVIKEIINLQKEIASEVGKDKIQWQKEELDDNLKEILQRIFPPAAEKLFGLSKEERKKELQDVFAKIRQEISEEQLSDKQLEEEFYKIEKGIVRDKILTKQLRPDNRKDDQIREISCRVQVLPRTHGSAIFRRGQTQSLAVITLGTSSDEQMIEALAGEKYKRFMLHYSFPPFSVGEVKPLRGPSRREIGHGALAEKAIFPVLPSKEDFPYTIRVVSEILESNGSSSMATVCAASLALMDAGVPIKEPVAGIAIGIVQEKDNYCLLTDIAGLEDHYGDMDFKIAGTRKGVTAIQLDVKNEGLNLTQIKEVLARGKNARISILEIMSQTIAESRATVAKYAPKIKWIKIDIDKIGELIGPGGRTIRKLSRMYNVTIDIDDEEGIVSVVADSEDNLAQAIKHIESITHDIAVGEIYEAKVVKLANYGAFCEVSPGKVGLLHVSEISNSYVKDVRDVLKEGDIVKVKVINVDPQGKFTLSKKQVE